MDEIFSELTPLHTLNPLNRFSDRVENYVKYRPSYPDAVIDKILEELSPQIIAADIGAGTGISSLLLAERGIKVIAIEPNIVMRNAGKEGTYALSTVEWRDGTAELTKLPNASVDLVTCFQAFHWFNPEASLLEFHRILKPSGRLAVVWNNRNQEDELTAEYSRLVRIASNNHPAESRMKRVEPLLASPYFVNVRAYTFNYQQPLDLDGLIGRAVSASYVPREGAAYEELITGLQDLYQRCCDKYGFVYMAYLTTVHLAESVT
ncbi:MAG: class I SAM-dependent methyltransferase [Calothrix sp. MO_167.B12]|nr:class I SAM-dependent methyltransferase [Calothrix sp. MO_167.B12]